MPASALNSWDEIEALDSGQKILILNFYAVWAEPCKALNEIFDRLADSYPNLSFISVEAEKAEEVTEKLNVTVVPTFIFIRNGITIDKVEGANGPELANKVIFYAQQNSPPPPNSSMKPGNENSSSIQSRLEKLVNYSPVMLFMKGTPTDPKCGFSSKIVEILKKENIQFDSFNILSDSEIREALKTYSNWPTYPQLYAKGQLIGGLDIVKELQENGQLLNAIPAECIKRESSLNQRLESLINRAPIMLFMKGTPEEPRCGFSAKIVKILKENNLSFSSFDILGDEDVRQGLKTYSNWPTFPQLYSKGKLIGGLDIVKELEDNGELLDALK
jgi:Grx4 family monothiol glutaredoxin